MCKGNVEHWKIYLEDQGFTIFKNHYFADLESLIYHYTTEEFLQKELQLKTPLGPIQTTESNHIPRQNFVKTMLLGLGNNSEVKKRVPKKIIFRTAKD